MNVKLSALKSSILADGVIDSNEVHMLREVIYADGKIDREEADFLFELNDAITGKNNDPAWKNLFVEAIAKYLLEDEHTPNEIDEKEAEWLLSKIEKDGTIDEVEKALLDFLKEKASKMAERLKLKI